MKKLLRFQARLNFKGFFFLCLIFFGKIFGFTTGHLFAPAINQKGIWIPDTYPVNARVGLEYTHIFDEKLVFSKEYRNASYFVNTIPGHSLLAFLTLNVKERVDLSFFGGELQLHPKVHYESNSFDIQGEKGFLWKAQGKAIIFEVKNTSVCLEAQYGRSSASVSSVKRARLTYHEWEIGLGLAQKISFFIPYAGISFRNAVLRYSHPSFGSRGHLRMMQDHKRGIFLGASVSPLPYFFLQIEGRLIHEKSIAGTLDVRF
ncbi:MAG: hypothetical protein WCP39_01590 [Chlamydiota bacterium]